MRESELQRIEADLNRLDAFLPELGSLKADRCLQEHLQDARKMLRYCQSVQAHARLGETIQNLADDQSAWSQKTFGNDLVRGPIGALKHLEKEAREAQRSPHDHIEYADCLLLILDASRRAGLSVQSLLWAAVEKQAINRERVWSAPTSDEPVEHTRQTGWRREFWLAVHNLIAHPLSQILWWASLCGRIKSVEHLSGWIHDVTYPESDPK